jgi:hypothetical protein
MLFVFWSAVIGLFSPFAADAGAGIGLSLASYLGLVYFIPVRRLWALKCFNCGKQAIFSPFFLMKSVRCQYCGVRAAHAEASDK